MNTIIFERNLKKENITTSLLFPNFLLSIFPPIFLQWSLPPSISDSIPHSPLLLSCLAVLLAFPTHYICHRSRSNWQCNQKPLHCLEHVLKWIFYILFINVYLPPLLHTLPFTWETTWTHLPSISLPSFYLSNSGKVSQANEAAQLLQPTEQLWDWPFLLQCPEWCIPQNSRPCHLGSLENRSEQAEQRADTVIQEVLKASALQVVSAMFA